MPCRREGVRLTHCLDDFEIDLDPGLGAGRSDDDPGMVGEEEPQAVSDNRSRRERAVVLQASPRLVLVAKAHLDLTQPLAIRVAGACWVVVAAVPFEEGLERGLVELVLEDLDQFAVRGSHPLRWIGRREVLDSRPDVWVLEVEVLVEKGSEQIAERSLGTPMVGQGRHSVSRLGKLVRTR